ncbi:MAG: hypothetical protein JWR25_491 [Noviherbaspirillum sp.]|jgi:hypothetical protein|nr:hypothetical protein [Noviherbaspirillum sp.]MDB5794112.1 hypothetical protein [Noviherbaspirillum sp.]
MAIPPVPPVDNVIPGDAVTWAEDLLPPPLPRQYLRFPLPTRLAPAEVDPFSFAEQAAVRLSSDGYILRKLKPSLRDGRVLLPDLFLKALYHALAATDEQAADPDLATADAARRAHTVLKEEIGLREWVASCRAVLQAA